MQTPEEYEPYQSPLVGTNVITAWLLTTRVIRDIPGMQFLACIRGLLVPPCWRRTRSLSSDVFLFFFIFMILFWRWGWSRCWVRCWPTLGSDVAGSPRFIAQVSEPLVKVESIRIHSVMRHSRSQIMGFVLTTRREQQKATWQILRLFFLFFFAFFSFIDASVVKFPKKFCLIQSERMKKWIIGSFQQQDWMQPSHWPSVLKCCSSLNNAWEPVKWPHNEGLCACLLSAQEFPGWRLTNTSVVTSLNHSNYHHQFIFLNQWYVYFLFSLCSMW